MIYSIMKTTTLLILLLISVTGLSQESKKYNIQFNAYSTLEFSKGIEIRPTYNDWYIAIQAENFYKNEEFFLNWGFSVGKIHNVSVLKLLYGIRVGFMVIDGDSKPSFGLETEINYNLSENFFIGLRGAYDVYYRSESLEQPKSYKLIRPFVKLGYIF